jgi:RsiW-degrading membrane proteinase PrsW (M82 family)
VKTKLVIIGLLIYLLVALFAICQFLSYEASWLTLITSVGLALVPIVPYGLIIIFMDKNEIEPFWMMLLVFVWGATFAAAASLVFNTMSSQLVGKEITATFLGPLVEEMSKTFIVVVLFIAVQKEFNNLLDGLVYGALAGLGFAMTENIFYYVECIAASGFKMGLRLFLSRGITSGFVHPLFTASAGAGLALSQNKTKVKKSAIISIGFVVAVVLHSLWNTSIALGTGFFGLIYYIVFVPALILVGVIAYLVNKEKIK